MIEQQLIIKKVREKIKMLLRWQQIKIQPFDDFDHHFSI